jgi:hypothetical protein
LRNVKTAEQERYREILAMQIKHTQTMQMQGTMTGEEKKMNRRDLKSFKEQDNNIQAMVIGINSTPEPKRNQTKLKIKTADN